MKKQILWTFISFFFVFHYISYSQNVNEIAPVKKVSALFIDQDILPLKLSYSVKKIKRNTNDSTYIESVLSYLKKDKTWETLVVDLRTRGHFRLENCYFPPIKIKIKKSIAKETLFKGNKKLKLVIPCLIGGNANDYIVKEYMAYRLFEEVSPYHFKTRLVDVEFNEIKNKKTKMHKLKGFLVEDDKKVANRFDGKVSKRNIHPMGQDPLASIRNAFFQYMIGNIDYSTMVQHNEKLLFINGNYVPLPYDFDMSGLVNSSYAVVSVVDDKPLVSSVTERLYRGFKRDPKLIDQVRQEFIDNQGEILDKVDSFQPLFKNQSQFSKAKNFIVAFFVVIKDDKKFEKEIMNKLRAK